MAAQTTDLAKKTELLDKKDVTNVSKSNNNTTISLQNKLIVVGLVLVVGGVVVYKIQKSNKLHKSLKHNDSDGLLAKEYRGAFNMVGSKIYHVSWDKVKICANKTDDFQAVQTIYADIYKSDLYTDLSKWLYPSEFTEFLAILKAKAYSVWDGTTNLTAAKGALVVVVKEAPIYLKTTELDKSYFSADFRFATAMDFLPKNYFIENAIYAGAYKQVVYNSVINYNALKQITLLNIEITHNKVSRNYYVPSRYVKLVTKEELKKYASDYKKLNYKW